ncbi:Anaerobic sulfite reductase subunit A [Candidatus Thermoflexus japonica]|uniref:Anaerobic sulfite reductase subunit A n=1 Tax=Candidatus Thermoflexus japonica TaxID=2035417 RepID=A0A2H5Y4Z6_9CHLR|nr:Anaerobic sulfite reductase subunit A [Candidatus Thermoflexus japonica]
MADPEVRTPTGSLWRMEKAQLQTLMEKLTQQGYTIIGPRIQEGAIVYDEVHRISDLPIGWTDEQDGGSYRLKRRGDEAFFGYAVGPHSWKRFLHPPVFSLGRTRRNGQGFEWTPPADPPPRYAFLGVRACELHAIAILDRVFMGGPYVDPVYRARREALFLIAVQCTTAGGTCFCASMGTGPKAPPGADLILTELPDAFVVEIGTERGAALMAEIPCTPATEADRAAVEAHLEETARSMGRQLDTADLPALLYRNLEHPRWEEVAQRCLTCGNCTMVCPTCFCFTVEDLSDLAGTQAERVRRWDSCFTTAFTYTAGRPIRQSAKARYRQWLTHKLASWWDQFGTSGCVGCGRCITWCPVGIDLTEEVRAIRETDGALAGERR